ncbi:MAG: NUDIX domain-containing protein [Micromonosporaceae bacterium]|nr:NUDIX domain-containing protein [Micromonosporaceae bacterium]
MPEAAGKPEAIVAVLRRVGRVLVIKRGPEASRSGYWAPLSGRIEPGESQRDAVAREVREEVGLRVRPLAKVWECDTDDGGFLLHWWTAEVEPGDLVLDAGEVSEARWVTPEEFLGMEPTFAGDRDFFEKVLPLL